MAYGDYNDFNDYLSSQFYGGGDPQPNNSASSFLPTDPTSDRSLQITKPGGEIVPVGGGNPLGGHQIYTAQAADQPDINGGGDGGGGGSSTPTAPSSTPYDPMAAGNQPSSVGVGAPGNATDLIKSWYMQFLGRGASDAEVQSHMQNPGGLGAIQNVIANSPEAMAYAKSQGFGQPNPGAPPPKQPPAGTNNGGFADPAYQSLLDLVNKRLGQLQTPVSFPSLDAYMKQLADQQAVTKQRAQTFADQLGTRVGQLQQPLMTDANVVQQRALASNATLAQRDALLERSRADLAARGVDPRTSGLAFDRENQIGHNYSDAQANIDAKLQQGNIQTDEQRRNLATNLQGLAMQALQGGDLSALQNQSQMAELENSLFNLNENRANQTLAVGQIPVDLTNQGFSNSLAASNSMQNPLAAILQLASLGNSQQGLQQAGQNSNMSTLAWLMQMLFK